MTYNRARLRLYKEPKLYNGSRYTKYFASESERDSYFANPDLDLGEIQYNSTDGTINVQRNLGVLLEYSYGILTVMDTDMYIFIDDIQVGYNDVSTIYYSIDYFETARFKFQVTKGHLTRYNGSKPKYMEQPYSALNMDIQVVPLEFEQREDGYVFINGCFVWSMTKTTGGMETSSLVYGVTSITTQTITLFMNGKWQELFGYADSDIKDCFIVPYLTPADIYTEDSDNNCFEKKTTTVSQGVFTVPIVYYESLPDQSFVGVYKTIDLQDVYHSTEQQKYYLIDWNGNIVWEAPYFVDFRYLHIVVDIGVTHCNIRGTLSTDPNFNDLLTGVIPYINENVGTGFCYECRHVSLFVDSYSEYVMRMRDYDVESRRIQNDVEFYKGLVGTAEAAGYGMAFGGPIGGLTSMVGGLTETIGTGLINNSYAPKIQNLEDKKYALMQDEMSIIGDSLMPLFTLDTCIKYDSTTQKYHLVYGSLILTTISMDESSKNVMNNDISINGYHCDETVSDIDSLIATGTIIQADNVVIEGTISAQYRIDIADRFSRGIEFI